ncbi:hypothetical protein [Hymenobacter perfusus]|uniref:Uncharacterized protein n=1 Tax=Hymenobacter perfusus TaxID=1236770 RepID=A0A3R9MMX8_9BACT|nr:hypothetical protein [Hymenobacter perfusus]RSK44234.1 hypothetical protein EI293_06750 [Hymenobacter perfusus]
MNRRLLPVALLLTFAACRSAEQETDVAESRDLVPAELEGEQSTTEKVGNTGRGHAYVRRFYEQKGRYYAVVDYVQFLKGADAVAAAQRRGDAMAEVQNGDTIYSVPNDYYIVNENKKERTLPLQAGATFRFWQNGGNGLAQRPLAPAQVLASPPASLTYAPFVVETRQGEVVRLTEQFVP